MVGLPSTRTGARRVHGADLALAAVLREIAQERIHALERGSIDETAALALLADQACIHQLFQLEGQHCGRDEMPEPSAITPGVMPRGPAMTNARNTRKRAP